MAWKKPGHFCLGQVAVRPKVGTAGSLLYPQYDLLHTDDQSLISGHATSKHAGPAAGKQMHADGGSGL